MTEKKKKTKKKAARPRKHPIKAPKVITSEEKTKKKLAELLEKVSDAKAKEKLSQVLLATQKLMPKDFRTAYKLLLHAAGMDRLPRPDLYVKQLLFTVGLELRRAGDDQQKLIPLRQLRGRIEDMRIAMAIAKA